MVQRGQDLGFALQTGQPVGILRQGRRQHLDGYITVEIGVSGAVDLAHAAGAEGGEDLVGAEARADSQTHTFERSYRSGRGGVARGIDG